jgi:hypothetical protein
MKPVSSWVRALRTKKPLFLLAAVFLLAGMIVYNQLQPQLVTKDFFAKRLLYQEKQMLSHLRLAQDMVDGGRTDDVAPLFERAIETDLFDWFIVTYQGQYVAGYPYGMEKFESLEQIPNQDVIDEYVSYTTRELSPGLLLTIGSNKRVQDYVDRTLRENTATTIQNILFPVAVAILIFFLLLKDIMAVLKGFANGTDEKSRNEIIENFSPHTKEAQILKSSLQSFDHGLRSQQSEIRALTAQLTPALKRELKSGNNEFPKHFQVIMVRLDINNYTPMFYSMNRENFQKILIKYFTEVEAHIQNYGGYLNDFVGDEAIFYFHVADGHAWQRAVGCIRDLFRFTESFGELYQSLLPGAWTVKAAAVQGELRLAAHLFGVTLGGAPFIESNRLLSKIQDRTKNNLMLLGCPEDQIADLGLFKCETHQHLKGIPYSQNTYELVEFHTSWKDLPSKSSALVSAFRDPQSISDQMHHLQALLEKQNYPQARSLLREFKNYPASTLIHIETKWIWQWLAQPQFRSQNELVCAADLIMLLKNSNLDLHQLPRYKSVLEKLMQEEDPRLYANTLELLSRFPHSFQSEFLPMSQSHHNSRVKANGLLLRLKQELNPHNLELLQAMLDSPESPQIISGLYVAHELLFSGDFDQVSLMSLTPFQNLSKSIAKLTEHKNPDVVRWAEKCLPRVRAA